MAMMVEAALLLGEPLLASLYSVFDRLEACIARRGGLKGKEGPEKEAFLGERARLSTL